MIPGTHVYGLLEVWREIGEESACTLEGGCMAPVLREGDRLVVRYGRQAFRVGDIVVCGTPGALYVQRVIGIERSAGGARYRLMGDSSVECRDPVPAEGLIGKVVEAFGAHGRLRFECGLWPAIGRLLALRSRVTMRCRAPATPWWKAVRALGAAKTRLLPRGFSLSLLPCRAACAWRRMRSRPRRTM